MTRSIRPFDAADADAVVDVWHRAGIEAYKYLPTWQAFTRDECAKVFAEVIVSQCDIWVGTENDHVVAYLAMRGSYIDRLYVAPEHQRHGWGTALVAYAMELQPEGLELHTHQQNVAACALYERLGFVPVKFGTSPPPESAPDVDYHWRPARITHG